jgi:hypothetical protein
MVPKRTSTGWVLADDVGARGFGGVVVGGVKLAGGEVAGAGAAAEEPPVAPTVLLGRFTGLAEAEAPVRALLDVAAGAVAGGEPTGTNGS